MKRRLSLVFVLSIALFGAYLQGQGGPRPSVLDVVKVQDDLFVIHNAVVPGNVTVLVTNEGVLLVDDKFAVDYDNIVAEVRKLTPQPIKFVISTHHHGDHTGGNAKMQEAGAQVITSEQTRKYMVDGNLPGMPMTTFDRRGFVHLGGKSVELYQFGRAHTGGDTFVYFPAHRVLSTGDAFTFGDETPQLVDYAGGGSAKDWPYTLDGALQLDFDTVVPGHGLVTTKAELRKFRDSTMAVRTRVHQMLVEKKTKDEIWQVLQSEFRWNQFQQRSVDGLMIELQ
ncbi:MAG: MBL fold metallo-hydrolase [Acidobacteria bacterium]|nr:MBL fold metallo-hydrolase [Acidobacteriota bacterium]